MYICIIYLCVGVLSAILNFVLEPPRREDTLVPGAEGIVSNKSSIGIYT